MNQEDQSQWQIADRRWETNQSFAELLQLFGGLDIKGFSRFMAEILRFRYAILYS